MKEPKIIFEDEDMLVVDKPSGVTVNKSDTTHAEMTVQDWIEKVVSIKYLVSSIDRNSDFYKRAGIVHRLDKETSGILLVAKTPEAFVELQKQFKERIVEKTYQALAHGELAPAEGEINVPVGRLEYNRKRFGVVAGGRDSVTYYKVISNFKYQIHSTSSGHAANEQLSLVELYPKTGRTHQIRVHLKYLNHPVFADELYGGRKTARQDRKMLDRLFLHAAKISFLHPRTGEKVFFESKLAEDLERFLEYLEKSY